MDTGAGIKVLIYNIYTSIQDEIDGLAGYRIQCEK